MSDLPIASPLPATATAVRQKVNALPCLTHTHHGTPQPNTSSFQDALALELGLGFDGPLLAGRGIPAAMANVGSSVKPGEDTAQTTFSPDAPLGLALAAIPPSPPALLALAPPADPGAAPLSPAFAPTGTKRIGLAADQDKDPLAKNSVPPKAEPRLTIAPAAADFAVAGTFPRVTKGDMAQISPTQKSELHLPVTPAAADLVAPDKYPPVTDGALRSEIAFDANLLERRKPVSAPATAIAIQTGGTAPAQVITPAPVAVIEARVGEHGWDQSLGDKLVWMAGQRQQVAELHLNPPDLGPLKITLTLDNDQASAQFVSAHATVREAIETAMPRLREMLADTGITLGNASVSTDAFREQGQPQHEPRAHPTVPAAAAAEPSAITRGERLLRRQHGLVDTFA